jgi:hypothetical protein
MKAVTQLNPEQYEEDMLDSPSLRLLAAKIDELTAGRDLWRSIAQEKGSDLVFTERAFDRLLADHHGVRFASEIRRKLVDDQRPGGKK